MFSLHRSKLILTGWFSINSPCPLKSANLLKSSEHFLVLKCCKALLCLAPRPPRLLLWAQLLEVQTLPWGTRAFLASFVINTSFLGFRNTIPSTDAVSTDWSLSLMLFFLTCVHTDPGQLITFPEECCFGSSPWLRNSSYLTCQLEQIQSHISHRQCCMANTAPENVPPILSGLRSSLVKQNWDIYSLVWNGSHGSGMISQQARNMSFSYDSHIGFWAVEMQALRAEMCCKCKVHTGY